MLLNLYTSIIDLGHTIILCKFFFKFTIAVFRCIDLLKPTGGIGGEIILEVVGVFEG